MHHHFSAEGHGVSQRPASRKREKWYSISMMWEAGKQRARGRDAGGEETGYIRRMLMHPLCQRQKGRHEL